MPPSPAHFGVPVTLVVGDEKAVAQTIGWVGDQCVGVVVKEGLSTTSALHLHPLKAQELIREGARQAVANAKTAKPYVLPKDVRSRSTSSISRGPTTRLGCRESSESASGPSAISRLTASS